MRLKVNGNSMWPLLKNGDNIIISKSEIIEKGDIITVHNSYGNILTHRVMDETNLVTKGDNNTFPERPLLGKPYKLLGRLDYVIKKGDKVCVNNYNKVFFRYSLFEMNTYARIKKIIPINILIQSIKQLMYSIFILYFKTFVWKK